MKELREFRKLSHTTWGRRTPEPAKERSASEGWRHRRQVLELLESSVNLTKDVIGAKWVAQMKCSQKVSFSTRIRVVSNLGLERKWVIESKGRIKARKRAKGSFAHMSWGRRVSCLLWGLEGAPRGWGNRQGSSGKWDRKVAPGIDYTRPWISDWGLFG